MVWNIPVVKLETAVLAMSAPNFLCMPSLLTGEGVQEAGVDTMQALLCNSKNISVLSTLFLAQI